MWEGNKWTGTKRKKQQRGSGDVQQQKKNKIYDLLFGEKNRIKEKNEATRQRIMTFISCIISNKNCLSLTRNSRYFTANIYLLWPNSVSQFWLHNVLLNYSGRVLIYVYSMHECHSFQSFPFRFIDSQILRILSASINNLQRVCVRKCKTQGPILTMQRVNVLTYLKARVPFLKFNGLAAPF